MGDLDLLTYCGLYCPICAERGRIPRQAGALKDSMAKEGWNVWGPDIPGFTSFWTFLSNLANPERGCSCRAGGGFPLCEIRPCAQSRGVDVCPSCADHPCIKIEALGERYPNLVADGRRLAEIGAAAWIAEQEERARAGFCYADIRCEPCDNAEK